MPTPRGYPFPAGTDPADVPADIEALATAVDTDVATVESDAASALAAHAIDQTGVHGIADTAALYRAGGTDVAVVDGGTGASTAAGARTNLGIDTELALKAPLASPALTGTVTIDGDVNLYRAAANTLKTDDALVVAGALSTPSGISAQMTAAGSVALQSAVSGDTQQRFAVNAAGAIEWGPGDAGRDVNLYRGTGGILKTDDLFQAVNGPMLGHAGAGQKVISGRVNADGSAAVGSGFTSAKTGTGAYTVTFTTPFSGVPHVVVSGSSVLNIGSANHLAGSVNVTVVRDDNGAAIDGEFNLIAIGPA